MIRIGDDVRVAIEAQKWREHLDPLDDVPSQHDPALGCEVPRNEKPQSVKLAGKNELAPEIREQDSSVPLVDRLGVGLALRKIEFLLGGAHIDAVIGELTEINLAMSHRQVFLGNDRNVVRPENRIAPAINFIHWDCDDAIAMRVLQREIDPNLGGYGKARNIELARGDHDLPLGAVNLVTIDVDARERIIGSQPLDLLQLWLKRAPIPDPRVLQRGGILFEVGGRERVAGHREFAFLDRGSLEVIGLAGAGD